MAITRIDVAAFVDLAARLPVIDVRSEGEYLHAHYPGAYSMPLFNNEERSVVGTAYKQRSREEAIKIGLRYFGPRMVAMIETAERLLEQREQKALIVYCWRGGMRSGGVAWLLDLYGFEVYTLIGGYKAFRTWGMGQFAQPYDLRLLGGYTGSGKTEVLAELQQKGAAVVDLEALALHKGSAFGSIGMPPQPSQEQFENLLALALWRAAAQAAGGAPIWLEDESQRIGTVNIPTPLYRYMQTRPVLFLDVPFDARVQHIVAGYGKADRERLVNAILRIQKRLGGLEARNAINNILEGNIAGSFAILLRYYDKLYSKTLQLRDNWQALVHEIPCTTADAKANARAVLQQPLHNPYV